jgi:hypothetical protein
MAEAVDSFQSSAAAPGVVPATTLKLQSSAVADQAARAALGGTAPLVAAGLQTGFVTGYVSPAEVYTRCQELARKYPDLVDMVERDYKTSGYDGQNQELRGPASLYYLRLGPKTPDRDQKLGVFQFAAPHARELVNPMIMLELAEQLLANYDPKSGDPAVLANSQLLQNLDIYLAPMTNPDGSNFSLNDDKMWRKTRVPTGDGNFGVDINRNYPTGWLTGDASELTYPGPAPLSEPETRNIVGVVDDHPNIRFVCDWHSYAEEIRRPWGVSEQDRPVYDELHGRMNAAIKSVRGRDYGQCVSEVVDGTSDDYFYQNRQIYSMLVETGRAFQPKPEEAVRVMQECVGAAREILTFAQEHQERMGLALAHPPLDLVRPETT